MDISPREKSLEDVVLDYIERFGLTNQAREFFLTQTKETRLDADARLQQSQRHK